MQPIGRLQKYAQKYELDSFSNYKTTDSYLIVGERAGLLRVFPSLSRSSAGSFQSMLRRVGQLKRRTVSTDSDNHFFLRRSRLVQPIVNRPRLQTVNTH